MAGGGCGTTFGVPTEAASAAKAGVHLLAAIGVLNTPLWRSTVC
jgi:hypothetical protein